MPNRVTAARAAVVQPQGPSEDRSDILVAPTGSDEAEHTGPDPRVNWTVSLEWSEPTSIPSQVREEILQTPTSTGFSAYTFPDAVGGWSYLNSAKDDDKFSLLSISTDLVIAWKSPPRIASEDDLREILERTKRVAKQIGSPSVTSESSPAEGAKKAQNIFQTWDEADWHVSISLEAPKGSSFDGKEVWDVMLSLGLRWGNMDLFHWDNPNPDFGSDALFSVHTTSGYGYFLPEQIAAGETQVDDLVFGYSVPRSPGPLLVFESMKRAPEYAQERLGGRITEPETNGPVDFEYERAAIDKAVRRLKNGGFTPGASSTLQLF
ncbi:MAG: cell division protein ZipA C-terminal FtsZ-binding domain-containing protein [Planctomycetota bacterium]